MSWFFLALLAPIFYALANHIDKYLLSRYFKAGEVGSLVLFSALFSFFALPIILIIEPAVFTLDLIKILVLAGNGSLTVFSIILYFYALEKEEASVVVPFYQTIPIFSFFLGYLILGETIRISEIIACFLIISGAMILSLDLKSEKSKIKYNVVFLMLGSSFLLAISGVLFKLIAVDAGFWISIFWEFIGRLAIGILIYLLVKSYREQFLQAMRVNKSSVLALNSLSETLFIAAEGIISFAYLLVPIVFVSTVEALQPFFVLIIGIIITIFFPKFEKETLSRRVIIQKVIAIGLIIAGACMLGFLGVY